jgi:hypothetical protein
MIITEHRALVGGDDGWKEKSNRCQFRQHFRHAFFVKFGDKNYKAVLWVWDFLAPKFGTKNVRVKHWWNWLKFWIDYLWEPLSLSLFLSFSLSLFCFLYFAFSLCPFLCICKHYTPFFLATPNCLRNQKNPKIVFESKNLLFWLQFIVDR